MVDEADRRLGLCKKQNFQDVLNRQQTFLIDVEENRVELFLKYFLPPARIGGPFQKPVLGVFDQVQGIELFFGEFINQVLARKHCQARVLGGLPEVFNELADAVCASGAKDKPVVVFSERVSLMTLD